ncbi:hypothetical protein Tco_1091601 [Tanacetum coccineum]|uniref:Uncharacterized protein n=1 Tax=Tanacetum coccineum TaxID=301880 RepID=A0ABQ5I9L5_9ASTR
MTERNDYISVTRKNCISNNNEGRMIERNFVEIQGTFFLKIRDNTLNGAIGENVFEHINKFLEVVGPIKINRVSQDRFRLRIFPISLAGTTGEWFKKDCIGSVTTWEDLVEKFVQKFYQLSDHDEEIEAKEDDDPDDITDIFKIKGNLFDFKTPLCKAFNEFNYLLKIDKDLFTFDIQGIRTYKEYELNNHVTRDLEEPWSDNRYDELADRILKEETLMHKAKVEESWGNATPGVMKFYAWLINSFRNIHELDYNVLVKLQECWWKINANEVAPFTHSESYGQIPNDDTSNIGNTQDNQGNKEYSDDPALEPSVYKIRRFEMMKYSFNADEEYIAIKESEYLNHSKDNLDAYRELLHIINEGWVMATPDDE